ncbi:hypothetical protein HanHA89_Chr10g0402261 [Helianthus annuus]|nr:hypothetical protein HanHA89_Chr10g0402261 [Helianthus annuus]
MWVKKNKRNQRLQVRRPVGDGPLWRRRRTWESRRPNFLSTRKVQRRNILGCVGDAAQCRRRRPFPVHFC